MKQVKITCQGADYAPLDDFIWFQGDLKTLPDENYKKLKKLILKLGFSEPVSIWDDGNQKKLLNGHQRILALRKMRDEGYKVPYIPFSIVEAKDEKEAKQKVLSLASEFGKMSEQGLVNFIGNDFQLKEVSEFNLHSIEVGRLKDLMPSGKEVEVSGHTRTIGKNIESMQAPKAVRKVKPGEVFKIGKHKLICSPIDAEKLLKSCDKHGPCIIIADPHDASQLVEAWESNSGEKAEAVKPVILKKS